MGWKEAIDGLLVEFRKINLKTGTVEEAIDLKSVESKLRILASETDRSHIGKEHLISIYPAVFLCLSSDDVNLRQSVARFLHNLKDLIEATSCSYSDWKSPINSEFVKLCADRLILIVEEFSDDWIEPLLLLVNILFTDIEGGSFTDISLFNHLLSVIEKAFKTAKVKTEKFKTAFQTWERFCTILADSLSYNKFLATAKRLNLLVLPFLSIRHLSADPYKHQAWFHVVEKIGLHSQMTVDEIVSPFLNFLIETRRIFIHYKDDVGHYLKVMSRSSLVFSKHSSELLKCLKLAIEHDSKQEDIIATWTSLCGYISSMDQDYFKKLLYFIKSTSDNNDKKDLTVELCLIAYQYKLFDFKSVYLNDIKSTCEEVFPVTITSLLFRDSVFQKILVEMLDMAENLNQEEEIDEEGCMSPILSMWELMITAYSGFVDASLDSRFIPNSVDMAIIRDLMILPLFQPLNQTPREKNTTSQLFSSFIRCFAKKTRSDLFLPDFLKKLGNGIRSSQISLDNCLWLASFASKLEYEVNMMPLMMVISKSIASCCQPKAVLQFLNILDKVTDKSSLLINFKAMLNYLRRYSSTYEPPYDQQIRQLAHSLLKRLENGEIKPTPLNNSEPEEKKHNIRTPTFHSNFLSRLSKAEEKKNNKNILAASIFPRNSEEAETNKENKQNIGCKDAKVDEIQVSPSSFRFAKSSAFILDNPEPSESLPVENFEPKVANFKISTDFHKAVSPGKIGGANHIEPGLSPNLSGSSKNKLSSLEPSPKSSPLNDKVPNSDGKSPKVQKNKYSFLDNNSLDNQDFVFVPPKTKASPLTKHQKEMLSKRREEIPALYQDLSQDTQNTTELSSNSQSSQEISTFTLTKKEDNVVLESQENHKQDDNITSTIEGNAVFRNLNENEIEKDGEVENQTEEEMKSRGSLSPKRLNFEGICGKEQTPQKHIKSSKEQVDALTPSPRKFARKSTSKYRKPLNGGDESKPSPLKRKFEEHLDDDKSNSSPCKKPALETGTPKNKATTLENNEPSSQKKRRGRKPKRKSDDGDTNDSTVTPVNILTSPVQTRRKRKSMTLKAESEIVLLDNIHEMDSKNQNVIGGINGGESVVCTDTTVTVEDPKQIPSAIPCDKESILVLEKNDDLESNVKNNDSFKDLSLMTDKENVQVSDVPSPAVQNQVDDVLPTEEQLPKTPPSVETPHRRKKSKQSIQHNQFSPKMLRRGRVQVKASPKQEKANKNVKRKSLDLGKEKRPDETRDKSPIQNIDSEVSKTVETENITTSDKNNDVKEIEKTKIDIDQVSQNRCAPNQPENNTDQENNKTEEVDIKVVSNQKSSSSQLMSSKQIVEIENKVTVNSKTSPTRTMRIMQLVVNGGLQGSGNQSSNGVENNCEDVKEHPSNNEKSIIKFNNSSRASLIMKNLKERSKPADSENKIDSKQVMTVGKDSVDKSDVSLEVTSTDNGGDSSSQHLRNGKQKSLLSSPTHDKKFKNREGISPGVKVKMSGLDSWLIKKDKNVTREVGDPRLKSTNELTVTPSKTQVIIRVDDPTSAINDVDEVTNSRFIESIESPSGRLNDDRISNCEADRTESDKAADFSQSPSRWPKRWRKDKKPSDFMYSPLKRSKTPDRKPKQPKQLELSPSKPYSFVNWPKGDCETWIACEPTPPEVSPATAILKRRSAYTSPSKAQISPNVTPKKRVSFLDPPVSKGLLYSKEEYGGEIQHALNDTGAPTVRRKRLSMDVSNYERDNKGIAPIGDHLKSSETIVSSNQNINIETQSEAVTLPSVVEPDSTVEKQPDSSVPDLSENDKNNLIITEENIVDSTMVTEDDPTSTSSVDERDSEVMVAVIESEENLITSVEVVEQVDEAMDVESEEVESNETYSLEPSASHESLANDESHSQEQEIDIVEKVVGKVGEGSAACIVEPIETCSMSELLSDESISNVEQDYISITDDILQATEQQPPLADQHDKTELHLETVDSLPCDNNVTTSPQTSSTQSNSKELLDNSVQTSVETPLQTDPSDNHENSDENTSLSERINENQMDNADGLDGSTDKITLNVVKIEVEPETHSVKKEILVDEISGNENISECCTSLLQDSSNLSHTSLPDLIKEKCVEFNRFLESIDVRQTPPSSLQDILSVISTMTILAQKVAAQP